MIIYKTTNLSNGKIYIGQSNGNNKSYLGSGVVMLNAIKKYGKDNFKKEILEECLTQKELDDKERFWISFYKSNQNEIGYNLMDGGNSGTLHSEETKIKMSDSHKGNKNFFFGKKHTDQTKKILSEKTKERLKNKENHPLYGRKFSNETKQKISNTRIKNRKIGIDNPRYGKSTYDAWFEKYGKEIADKKFIEFKEKMKIINNNIKRNILPKYGTDNPFFGRKHSDETKLKLSNSHKGNGKKVIQMDLNNNFIKEWNSVTEIKEKLGINAGRVCRGERKKSGGYLWKFKD
jgi:group I intron endonuclease